MPFMEVKLLTGRSQAQKALLVEKLTEAMAEALNIAPDGIHVILYELPRENWGRGGTLFSARHEG